MNIEKENNIAMATKIWMLLLRGQSMSFIAKELKLHKSEISNLKKYTIPEMYMADKAVQRCLDELFELRRFKKNATKKINLLIDQLEKCEKPWWRWVLDRLENIR